MIAIAAFVFTFAVVAGVGLAYVERPYFPRHGTELFFDTMPAEEVRFLFRIIRMRQLRHG